MVFFLPFSFILYFIQYRGLDISNTNPKKNTIPTLWNDSIMIAKLFSFRMFFYQLSTPSENKM